MPIKPIDLQTLFMQLGQVGKQQAAERDAAAVQQSLQGNEAAKKQVEEAKSVRRMDEDKSGTGAVRPDERGSGERKGQDGRHGEAGEGHPDRETVTDPDLGTHVDLSG